MAAEYVTLILDRYDGAGAHYGKGFASLAPSMELPDPADQMLIGQAPVVREFQPGTLPQVRLVSTDSVGPQADKWTWNITFSGVPGSPPAFSFHLRFSDGATQYLSALAQVPVGQTSFQYLPLSGGTLTGELSPSVITLTDAASVTPVNAALGNVFSLQMTSAVGATRAITAPSNPTDGQTIKFLLLQPASGGPCAVTWAGAYSFGSAGAPALQTAASAGDLLGFEYSAALGKWVYLGIAPPAASSGSSLPLPSGTASAGDVPVATGSGEASAWGTAVLTLAPSGDTTGTGDAATINGAVTALGSGSATLRLAPGNWYLKPGAVTVQLANTQTIVIDGQWGAFINTVAGTAGDVIRMYNPNSQSGGAAGNTFSLRSGVQGVFIDGTSATAGSTGLHIGDLMNPQVDVVIRNFSGAGDIGLHLDNTISWTESGNIRAALLNCASHVVFEVTTGWNSFSYNSCDFTIQALAGQDGVVLKNGAYLHSATLRAGGGFETTNTPVTNAVLRLTGAAPVGTPSAGQYSTISDSLVNIAVESNGSNTYAAQTIFLDSNTFMGNNAGLLNFDAPGTTAFVACNIVLATSSNSWQFACFNGILAGDANLNPGGVAPSSPWTAVSPLVYSQTSIPVFSGTAFPVFTNGDFFQLTLTTSTTIGMQFNSGAAQRGPQRKTIMITQAASGGPYTVTWPHTGSPTLTSPTVLWPGGTPPTMTASAGKTDMYELSTLDGITWVGRATQNVS